MKKLFLLIISVLLITGCSVKYSLVINEDLSIVEEANLTGTEDFFASYYKTTKINVIKSFLDLYKDTLDKNNYQYEVVNDKTPYVNVKKEYNTVNDYTNSSIFFGDYFEKVSYTEDGDIRKIETTNYNRGNPDDNQDRFYLNKLEISINCPYKVTNHNAKRVDKSTNTYYYELSDNDKIIFEYDISSKFNPYTDLIRTLILCGVAIIVLWIIIITLNKKNKSVV